MRQDGCEINIHNIEHPLIQQFFRERGLSAKKEGRNFFSIEGNLSNNKGEDLHSFLLRHGVNLRENPNALNTDGHGKLITIMFDLQAASADVIFSEIRKGKAGAVGEHDQARDDIARIPGFKK